jgi:uncharacterized membrane protein YbhN (UPF0104 family)
MIKACKKLLPIFIIVIIFVFLIRNLVQSWSRIPFGDLHFNGFYLLISFIALIVHFLIYSKSWQEMMRTLGTDISFSQSWWMIATTQIAKYVPGRIWYMVGRIYVGRKEKMDGRNLAVSMVLETCLLLISSGVIFIISTVIVGAYNRTDLLICVITFIGACIILNPRVISSITNFFLKIFKKPAVKITVSYGSLLKLSVYFFGLWIAQIIGFYFLVNALYPVGFLKIFNVAGAYTLSWIAGFVVVLVPGGLGIREGVMTLLLSRIISDPLAIVISFIARVWITVFEVVIFFVGLVVRKTGSVRSKTR